LLLVGGVVGERSEVQIVGADVDLVALVRIEAARDAGRTIRALRRARN